MMIHTIPDRDRAELAHKLDKPLDGQLKHTLPEGRCSRRRIPTDAIAREAAPPILPAIRRWPGLIPVEIVERQLPHISLGPGHINALGMQMQHQRRLVLTGVADRPPAS